jgi:hypothetical protein
MSKQTNKILGLLMNDDVDVFIKYSKVFFTGQIQLAPWRGKGITQQEKEFLSLVVFADILLFMPVCYLNNSQQFIS